MYLSEANHSLLCCFSPPALGWVAGTINWTHWSGGLDKKMIKIIPPEHLFLHEFGNHAKHILLCISSSCSVTRATGCIWSKWSETTCRRVAKKIPRQLMRPRFVVKLFLHHYCQSMESQLLQVSLYVVPHNFFLLLCKSPVIAYQCIIYFSFYRFLIFYYQMFQHLIQLPFLWQHLQSYTDSCWGLWPGWGVPGPWLALSATLAECPPPVVMTGSSKPVYLTNCLAPEHLLGPPQWSCSQRPCQMLLVRHADSVCLWGRWLEAVVATELPSWHGPIPLCCYLIMPDLFTLKIGGWFRYIEF